MYTSIVPTGVGRFQVMAMLQAARAKVLGLPTENAKSWGLNRAIFYAAAKRGFTHVGLPTSPKAPRGEAAKGKAARGEGVAHKFHLGDDKAYAVSARGRTQVT